MVTKTEAKVEANPEPKVATVRMGATDVPIHPMTGRPTPGFIIDNHHKIPWTRRDIEEIYGMCEWENHTGLVDCNLHGIHFSVGAGEGQITPTKVRDGMKESARMGARKDGAVRAAGCSVTVGPLEPRD